MAVQLCGLLVIECLSLFGITRFKLKNEYMIPITCMSMGLMMFIFGMAGLLRVGVYTLMGLSALTVVYTVIYCARKHAWQETLSNTVTPTAVIFVCLYFALCYFNSGWLVCNWDEFSHWADVVKAMSYINDFSTSPLSHSLFKSYPPAMALFQYFFQVLYQLLDTAGGFSEWRLIFAYQLYVVALVLPFISMGTRGKTDFANICICALKAVVVVLALTYFNLANILRELYIDSFVGAVAGTAIAHTMRQKERPAYRNTVIFLSCATLVLAKDVGIFFAVFVVIINCVTQLRYERSEDKLISECAKPRIRKQEVIFLLLSVGCIAVPKLLWKLQIHLDQVSVSFSEPYDLGVLLNIILGKDTTFRSKVFPIFFAALMSDEINVGCFSLPCISALVLLLEFILFITIDKQKKAEDGSGTGAFWKYIYFIVIFAMSLAYVIGLPITYIFKFGEYEALRLASFNRYIGILFTCLWLTLVLSYISAEHDVKREKKQLAIFVSFIVLCAGWIDLRAYSSKTYVMDSLAFRESYDMMSDKVHNTIGDNDANIYVIAQETGNMETYISRFLFRPYTISGQSSIGEAPFYDGDVWTEIISPEDWKARVLSDYDYVVIYTVNDYFVETYSDFFENNLQEYSLYEVDKTDGICRIVANG